MDDLLKDIYLRDSKSISYGNPIWRTNAKAAFEEACRRVQIVLSDPNQTSLFLSDLYALAELPKPLAECTHLLVLGIGDAKGPDGENYIHRGTRQVADFTVLSQLLNLKTLSLFSTQISDLGPLSGLKALESLDCSKTQIGDLGPLSGLTALESLTCAHTRLSDLEPLSGLTALESLDCSRTQVMDLGPLSELTALENLNCSSTYLMDLGPVSGLIALQSLNCSNTYFSDLGPVSRLVALQDLDCYNTQIRDLAPVSELILLRSLDCSYTQINDLGPVSKLTSLERLNCSGTQICDLGPIIGLAALDKLDCSCTQISDLGPLSGLAALRDLICFDTQIRNLDPLSGLAALEILFCSNTAISDIGPLSDNTALAALAIDFCNLRIAPELLSKFPSLEFLSAVGTSIPGIPQEVLSQSSGEDCLDRLKAHLVDLGDAPLELGDVKLMVLGNGRIGKTQICNRLRGLDFEENANSTHGITLATAPIPDRQFVFNIWDFGGQDIYHGTHALFLKSRAIFLLVWTPEAENSETQTDVNGMVFRNQKLDWWLDYVRRFGSDSSPVIVVQNQIDITPDNGDHPAVTRFRESGSNSFCRSMGYSAKDKIGHPTLLDNLVQATKRFNPPLIGQGRQSLINKLRELRKDDAARPPHDRLHRKVAFVTFEQMCEEVGQISNPRLFLEFLHNAGEVFWREGHFGDQIILDQAWVLEAIYTVFNRDSCVKTLKAQEGRFSASLLDGLVWGKSGYGPDEQTLFLDFMKASGICFGIGDGDSEILITPDYLPEHFPKRELVDFEGQSKTTLEYENLPPILMRNLIVRIGQKAGAQADYWRHGLLFYDTETGSKIMVEQSCAQDWSGEVRLKCAGRNHQNALDSMVSMLSEECWRLGVSPKQTKHIRDKTLELSPGPDPERPKSYYISYAWDDKNSKPDNQLTKIVDDLCAKAVKRGIHIHRDKDEIKLGGRISEFMQNLTRGDRIIVILSDKYLRSRACMAELYGIWLQARGQDEALLTKVRVFTHQGTKVRTAAERAKIAKAWSDEHASETSLLDHMGERDRVGNLALKKFAANVGDILYLFGDTLQPRNIDELADYTFDD